MSESESEEASADSQCYKDSAADCNEEESEEEAPAYVKPQAAQHVKPPAAIKPPDKGGNQDKNLVKQIMREQQRKLLEKLRGPNKGQLTDNGIGPDGKPKGPPVVHADGYIENKVNFQENLSEDDQNSWNDDASYSEGSVGEDDAEEGEGIAPLGEINEDEQAVVQNSGEPQIAKPECKEVAKVEVNDNDSNQSFSGAEKKKRMTMNVYCTEYEVVKKVGRKVLNFRLKNFREDHDGAIRHGQTNQKLSTAWDLSWHDLSTTADFLTKMCPYQKCNMYPGIQIITRKHYLARNLMRMLKAFPNEYDFFPRTWVLPNDLLDLRSHWFHHRGGKGKRPATYIVKPDSMSQGKGIFLSRNIDHICSITLDHKDNPSLGEHPSGEVVQNEKIGYVVQHYVDRPHLIDDLKYDLRLYVMIYGTQPLRIYLHQFAFARFCTETYSRPTNYNLNHMYMHLTNYAINKYAEGYEDCDDDDGGHKRSLGAILQMIKEEGGNPDKIMDQIKDGIVKTIITGQPQLAHMYRICQPDCLDNSMCFQILGFDFLIDKSYKPLLLEVNCSPSFATDSGLDYRIKKNVVADAFKLLNFDYERKMQWIRQHENEVELRQMTGKVAKMTPQERERQKKAAMAERVQWESTRMGGYELLFPSADKERNKQFEVMLSKSNEIFDDFTIGKRRRMQMQAEAQEKADKEAQRKARMERAQQLAQQQQAFKQGMPPMQSPGQQQQQQQWFQQQQQQPTQNGGQQQVPQLVPQNQQPVNQIGLQQQQQQQQQVQHLQPPNAQQQNPQSQNMNGHLTPQQQTHITSGQNIAHHHSSLNQQQYVAATVSSAGGQPANQKISPTFPKIENNPSLQRDAQITSNGSSTAINNHTEKYFNSVAMTNNQITMTAGAGLQQTTNSVMNSSIESQTRLHQGDGMRSPNSFADQPTPNSQMKLHHNLSVQQAPTRHPYGQLQSKISYVSTNTTPQNMQGSQQQPVQSLDKHHYGHIQATQNNSLKVPSQFIQQQNSTHHSAQNSAQHSSQNSGHHPQPQKKQSSKHNVHSPVQQPQDPRELSQFFINQQNNQVVTRTVCRPTLHQLMAEEGRPQTSERNQVHVQQQMISGQQLNPNNTGGTYHTHHHHQPVILPKQQISTLNAHHNHTTQGNGIGGSNGRHHQFLKSPPQNQTFSSQIHSQQTAVKANCSNNNQKASTTDVKVRTFEITPVRKVNLLPGASPIGAVGLKSKGLRESDNNLLMANAITGNAMRLSPSKKMLSFPNDSSQISPAGRLEIIQHHSSSKELLKTSQEAIQKIQTQTQTLSQAIKAPINGVNKMVQHQFGAGGSPNGTSNMVLKSPQPHNHSHMDKSPIHLRSNHMHSNNASTAAATNSNLTNQTKNVPVLAGTQFTAVPPVHYLVPQNQAHHVFMATDHQSQLKQHENELLSKVQAIQHPAVAHHVYHHNNQQHHQQNGGQPHGPSLSEKGFHQQKDLGQQIIQMSTLPGIPQSGRHRPPLHVHQYNNSQGGSFNHGAQQNGPNLNHKTGNPSGLHPVKKESFFSSSPACPHTHGSQLVHLTGAQAAQVAKNGNLLPHTQLQAKGLKPSQAGYGLHTHSHHNHVLNGHNGHSGTGPVIHTHSHLHHHSHHNGHHGHHQHPHTQAIISNKIETTVGNFNGSTTTGQVQGNTIKGGAAGGNGYHGGESGLSQRPQSNYYHQSIEAVKVQQLPIQKPGLPASFVRRQKEQSHTSPATTDAHHRGHGLVATGHGSHLSAGMRKNDVVRHPLDAGVGPIGAQSPGGHQNTNNNNMNIMEVQRANLHVPKQLMIQQQKAKNKNPAQLDPVSPMPAQVKQPIVLSDNGSLEHQRNAKK